MATLTNSLPELTTNQRDIRINQFTPKVCRPWVKEKGKRLINEDLLSLSDFFSRSTTAITDTNGTALYPAWGYVKFGSLLF